MYRVYTLLIQTMFMPMQREKERDSDYVGYLVVCAYRATKARFETRLCVHRNVHTRVSPRREPHALSHAAENERTYVLLYICILIEFLRAILAFLFIAAGIFDQKKKKEYIQILKCLCLSLCYS